MKVLKQKELVDILGKIVVGQEKKNMILFDIYESGKTIRRLVIN